MPAGAALLPGAGAGAGEGQLPGAGEGQLLGAGEEVKLPGSVPVGDMVTTLQ